MHIYVDEVCVFVQLERKRDIYLHLTTYQGSHISWIITSLQGICLVRPFMCLNVFLENVTQANHLIFMERILFLMWNLILLSIMNTNNASKHS